MTNIVLNVIVLAALVVVSWRVLRRLRPGPLVWTAVVMCVLTLVFDTLMIAADLYVYHPDKILGVYLWGAARGLRVRARRRARDAGAVDRARRARSRPHRGPRARARSRARACRGGRPMKEVLAASRPFSWINTAYPFAAGYLVATGGRVDLALVLGTLYFLVPYNLLMYGVNDVFDYASDLRNPRKGGIEGALADPATARVTHRRILRACVATNVPFLVALLLLGDPLAGAVLALVVFGVVAYSAPRLRFKERPFLDSFTSAMHFAGPLLYALVLVDADLSARSVWPVLVGFVLWGMASHAFGAVQDVRADREGGIASVATAIGAHATVLAAAAAYVGRPSCSRCSRGPASSPRCSRCRTRSTCCASATCATTTASARTRAGARSCGSTSSPGSS